jgi:hypothetical protein
MDRRAVDDRDLWDKIWKDRHGEVVLAQIPNKWLIAWAILSMISMLSSSSKTANIFWWLSVVVLVIWAFFEIRSGVNYFRKSLGVFALLFVILATIGLGF